MRTPAEWDAEVAGFEAKRKAQQDRAAELKRRKAEISRASALGDEAARKELVKVNGELERMTLEDTNWDTAISESRQEKKRAEQAKAEADERACQERVAKHAIECKRQLDRLPAWIAEGADIFVGLEKASQAMDTEMIANERKKTQQEDWIIRALDPRALKKSVALAMCRVGLHRYIVMGVGDGNAAEFTPPKDPMNDTILPIVNPLIRATEKGKPA
jgi:hypothetical protein